MNNWKVIPTIVIATVLIFGAGVFTGGMLVNYVKQSRPKTPPKVVVASAQTNAVVVATPTNAPSAKQPKPPEILSKDFLQRLDKDLRLNTAQREAVQKIINEGQDQMRKTLQVARLEIREVLSPEQLKQFDEMMKRSFKKPIFSTNSVATPVLGLLVTNSPITNAP